MSDEMPKKRTRKKRKPNEPPAVTARLPGHHVRDREPDKTEHRPHGDELLHIPSLVWIMRELDTLHAKTVAGLQTAGRDEAASAIDWMRQKVIGFLQREWDRQRQKLSRLNRKTAERVLDLERTVARRKAGKLLKDLRALARLETVVGKLAQQAMRGRAPRHWMFVEAAEQAPAGGGLVEVPAELRPAPAPAAPPAPAWTRALIEQVLGELNPEALLADDLDGAFLGPAVRCGQPTLAAYSYSKAVDILIAKGMEPDEALEWMDFNVVGAWVGPHTPIWLRDDDIGDYLPIEPDDEDGAEEGG